MKKLFVLAALVSFVFACSRQSIPAEEIIISNKKEEKTTGKNVTAGNNEVAAGKTVYTTRCGRCHSLKTVDQYTPEQWENILKAMIPKANLTEQESKAVNAYIMDNAKK